MTDGILQITEPLTDEQIAEFDKRWAELIAGAYGVSPLVFAAPIVFGTMSVTKKIHDLRKGEQSMRKDGPVT